HRHLLYLPTRRSSDLEEVVEEEIFTIVEDMPEFPGGIQALYKYLGENVSYPQAAKANGISGKVFVNFTVEKDGSITDVKIIRGRSEEHTSELQSRENL